MKKIKILGKILTKDNQKKVKGGDENPDCYDRCSSNSECNGMYCAKDLIPGCGWDYKRCTILPSEP